MSFYFSVLWEIRPPVHDSRAGQLERPPQIVHLLLTIYSWNPCE
jgi:hypothetical protein